MTDEAIPFEERVDRAVALMTEDPDRTVRSVAGATGLCRSTVNTLRHQLVGKDGPKRTPSNWRPAYAPAQATEILTAGQPKRWNKPDDETKR